MTDTHATRATRATHAATEKDGKGLEFAKEAQLPTRV